MKIYKFKLQWVFHINFDQEVKDMFAMMKIIGPRSLTVVNFLDHEYKIVFNYNSMVQYNDVDGLKKFKEFFRDKKKNGKLKEVTFVEFVRR